MDLVVKCLIAMATVTVKSAWRHSNLANSGIHASKQQAAEITYNTLHIWHVGAVRVIEIG